MPSHPIAVAFLATVITGLSTLTGFAGEIRVAPGQSIQAAVDRALPGDLITVSPGTYHEAGRPCPTVPAETCAVVVTTDNLTLQAGFFLGMPVILENSGHQDTGIAFAKAGATGSACLVDRGQRIQGASVTGFTVRNFNKNGIYLLCADNWSLQFNAASNNLEYGFFPSHCGSGDMSFNIASGAHDTGFYIGQSHDARIRFNLAYDNVSGFEIENSFKIEVGHNEAFHNTAGVVVFLLPGEDVLLNQDNQIDHNYLHDNNSPNTCLDPEDDVCMVPPGIGILNVAGDRNQIDHNTVIGNETFGIAVTDLCTALQIPGGSCPFTGSLFLSQSTKVDSNVAQGNGQHPQFPGFPGADLIWSGTGSGNCWKNNQVSTVFPSPLPSCH